MPSTIGITANQLIWKFTPRQLSGLVTWLDAYDGNDFTYWSGSDIEMWKSAIDGSAGPVSLFQTNAPNYSGSLSGHTAVNFDGIDEYFYGSYSSATHGQELTAIMVCDQDTVDGSLISFQRNGANGYIGILGAGPGVLAAGAAIAGRRKTDSGTESTTAVNQSASVGTRGVSYDGTDVTLYINDTVTNTAASSGTTTLNTLIIGASGIGSRTGNQPETYFNGLIGEIIIYNRALTATEYSQVHDYLYYKWITY